MEKKSTNFAKNVVNYFIGTRRKSTNLVINVDNYFMGIIYVTASRKSNQNSHIGYDRSCSGSSTYVTVSSKSNQMGGCIFSGSVQSASSVP